MFTMCDFIQLFTILSRKMKELEFYAWHSLYCKLENKDCYRIAYTYGVKEYDPEIFAIIDDMDLLEAKKLFMKIYTRFKETYEIEDYIKLLAINHLYLSHEETEHLLSDDFINILSRKYGWEVVGTLIGVLNNRIETYKCSDYPSLQTWIPLSNAYRGEARKLFGGGTSG